MPATPQGIWFPSPSDAVTPLEVTFSTMASSIDGVLAGLTQIHKVADTAERNALVSQYPPSGDNPLFVWRADADNGQQLEYTRDGTTWHHISTSESGDITQIHKVADVTERDALVSQFPPSAADPLVVWRADATDGQNLEYTKDGTTWDYVNTSETFRLFDGTPDVSTPPTDWPLGVTIAQIDAGVSGWPVDTATLRVVIWSNHRGFQEIVQKNTGRTFIRTANGTTWSAWREGAYQDDLTDANLPKTRTGMNAISFNANGRLTSGTSVFYVAANPSSVSTDASIALFRNSASSYGGEVHIRADGTRTARFLPDGRVSFPEHSTTSNSANVYMSSSGVLSRSTSSARYKVGIAPLDREDAHRILDAEPVTYHDRSAAEAFAEINERLARGEKVADEELELIEEPRRQIGLLAEQLHDVGLTDLVGYDEEGRPDWVAYDRVAVALLSVVKDLAAEVKSLRSRLDALSPAHEEASK